MQLNNPTQFKNLIESTCIYTNAQPITPEAIKQAMESMKELRERITNEQIAELQKQFKLETLEQVGQCLTQIILEQSIPSTTPLTTPPMNFPNFKFQLAQFLSEQKLGRSYIPMFILTTPQPTPTTH